MDKLIITVELPAAHERTRILIADLDSWLRRYGLELAGWELVADVAAEEELGPAVER